MNSEKIVNLQSNHYHLIKSDMENSLNILYKSPEAVIIEVASEGILCESLPEKDSDWGN